MKDLEARKRLLVAESEVYRQTLRLDVQNVKLYGYKVRQKFASYAALKPLLLAGFPVASALFSRRRAAREDSQPKSLLSKVLMGYRLYRQVQPMLATVLAQFAAKAGISGEETRYAEEASATASEDGSISPSI